MDQVWEFFRKLFDTSDFPPRWHCGHWTSFHGWFYIISDLLIWSAYFAIPLIIIRYISRKQNARFVKLYFLFAAFILACGSTHLLDAITFWYPLYRFSALIRFITGVISWITVFSLIKLIPTAVSLKTAAQLEAEVEQRKKAEEQLRINIQMLKEAQEISLIGHWRWDVIANKITWSDMIYKIYGVTKNEMGDIDYGAYLNRIHPEDRVFVNEVVEKARIEKKFPEFFHRLIVDGAVKTVHSRGEVIVNETGEVTQMIGTVQDVTEQKKVEKELLSKTQALEVTNMELEKFASVASHDLQEPLRKIITFSDLLEKEYRDVLNDKGKMYLDKVTDASARMQRLIRDVLEFSMLTDTHIFAKTSLREVLSQVLSDMEVLIANTHAKITLGALHEIEGNATQLRQLFQNLISNAIKFRKIDEPPEIKIHSEIIKGAEFSRQLHNMKYYKFSVLSDQRYWDSELFCRIYIEDNGIGFEEEYAEIIFELFQRLHGRSDYEGTGIGLAICRKVVDIHNGHITAKSNPGEGTTFIITMPVSQKHFRDLPQ